jgi:hypothetical protein
MQSDGEDIMKRERVEYRKPYGRGDYELLRGGEGVYWQAGNGLEVRIAAAEHQRDLERERRDPLGEVVPLEVWPTGFAR